MLSKDNSSSVGLRNQKLLVQIQVEAKMTLIVHTSLLVIFFILIYPLFTTLSPDRTKYDIPTLTKTAVSSAFFVSLLPLIVFLNLKTEGVITN